MADIIRDINLLRPDFKLKVMNLIDLVKIHNIPIQVFETLRNKERQQDLFNRKLSKTLNSKHLEGIATDFVVNINGAWTWEEKYIYYYKMFGVLAEHIGLVYGGNWINFKDYPHVELKV